MIDYDENEIPPASIEVNQKLWTRERVDSDYYQWVRPMQTNEYDWDSDEVSLVGTDEPIRLVSLQLNGDRWDIEGAETAGPEYHRPGFTELINSEFSRSVDTLDEAVQIVEDFIQRLS